MNTKTKVLMVLIPLLSGRAMADSDPAAESAATAAKNMAYVSSTLSAFENGLNETALTRATHILAVRNRAFAGHRVSTSEIDVLRKTDGEQIVMLYEALCEYGDKAALASSQASAAEAAAKAEIAAAYTPLKISTEKLDSAAKSLASLSKEQTDAERAKSLVAFFKETRDETKRLLEASAQSKQKADGLMQEKTAEVAAADPPTIKK